jgi:hypothetical protein
MIESLDDAWKWYDAARTIANDMKRLAEIWDDPALQTFLRQDNRFRDRPAAELTDAATTILNDLDDLAVLVFFTAFEANVRDRALEDVDRETAALQHHAVLRLVGSLKNSIEKGSFDKLREAYKTIDKGLNADVGKLQSFRHWVAHGRRGEPKEYVDPAQAIGRLRRYLALLSPVPEIPPET